MGTIYYLVDHVGKRALYCGKSWYDPADESNFTIEDIDRHAADMIAKRAAYLARDPGSNWSVRDTRFDDIARRWLIERSGAKVTLISDNDDYPWRQYAPEPPPPEPWPSWLIRPPGWEPVRDPTPDPELVEGWVIDVPWLGPNCPDMDDGEALYPPDATGLG